MKVSSTLRLMRFHKPAGILLLWFPTAWALWAANQGNPPMKLICLFFLGTVLMRAAGCVMNDIADRNIDIHVTRTKTRPLASGEVGLMEAFGLLVFLLICSLVILLLLPAACFYYALLALFITILYPFCKRFLQAPQLVLGLAFSMGIPMAYAASGSAPDSTLFCLLLINFLWIVAYDTEYAMVDREDDLQIGVQSTAIWFAQKDRLIIGLLQATFHLSWLFLAFSLHFSRAFLYLWMLASFVLLYQQKLLVTRESALCLRAFSSNSVYGFMLWIAIALAY